MENTENTNAEEQNIEDTTDESIQAEASEDTAEDNVEVLNADANTKDEGDDYKQKYYYLAAEIQNMQRRFDKDKENLLKYGSEKILRDILDVVDNFERTLGFIQADKDEKVKNIAVGIDMIAKQFVDTLGNHGLKKVDALGKDFDPNFHEALGQEVAEGKKEMEIIKVHQAGYTLNERLLRPAKVVVVKNEA
jgi:molecular chaperone GrpE